MQTAGSERVERQTGAAGVIRAEYLRPAFLICAAVLAISGAALSATIKVLGIYLKKEPLLLKAPLSTLDKSDLGWYRVMKKDVIESEDVVKTLGTEDYIQWQLEDTNVPDDSPVRFCALFITYYGLPDVVPHVPDECYTGGGYQMVSKPEDVTLDVARQTDGGQVKAGVNKKIPATYVVFSTTETNLLAGGVQFPVMYTFGVNGDYAAGRNTVRGILNRNILRKYSYFSKVEWKFYNYRFGRLMFPGRDEAIRASERMLGVLLPVLERKHWPTELSLGKGGEAADAGVKERNSYGKAEI